MEAMVVLMEELVVQAAAEAVVVTEAAVLVAYLFITKENTKCHILQ
jgi:hypothetical protein